MRFFQAGNCSKGCIIHYHPYYRNFRFHCSGHYRHMVAKSSVTHKRQNSTVRLCYFNSQRGGRTKPHGCQTAWRNKRSRYGDWKLLGYAILVPPYICHEESVFR